MKLITDKARLSLLKRIKETESAQNYMELKQVFKYHDQLSKRPKRFKNELKKLNEDLKEHFQNHEPFLQAINSPILYSGTDDYVAAVRAAASDRNATVKSRRYLSNYWCEDKQMRVTEEHEGYVLETEWGLTEFTHPKISPMPNAVKILWFYLKPEFQGDFYKTKKLIRLSYDLLLNHEIFTIYGTVSQVEQSFYPFASKTQESSLLAARNDKFLNNLQRMYVASGAIAIDDQVFWMSPDGVQLWLLRSDSEKFRESLDQLRKNRKSIFTNEEREHHSLILEGSLL